MSLALPGDPTRKKVGLIPFIVVAYESPPDCKPTEGLAIVGGERGETEWLTVRYRPAGLVAHLLWPMVPP